MDKELQDLIDRFGPLTKYRAITVFSFFIIISILIYTKITNIHAMVAVILLFWSISQWLAHLFLKITKSAKVLKNVFFVQLIFDMFVMTAIVYYIGGVEWIGTMFYIFPIVYSGYFIDNRLKRYFLVLLAFVLFSITLFLEFFEIIPFISIVESTGLHKNLYFILTTLSLSFGTFVLISLTVEYFSERLKKQAKQLSIINVGLEGAVRERTKELENIKVNLEKTVKQRTRELERKVDELERFYNLAIGRELKMIELKKKIRKVEYDK